ncbi:hypothetical protein HNP84_006982 [Thermocatellispora tengchongensis]|uniref:Intein C-terminal splicing domain-containing protein n=2 Tax=Thermocatellispora tengchongensis TaxID=1073253 RepID=A0A840PI58_9ACTN|nr:hypothetical protein [Thermocatellispora tengchongensis]
MWLRTAVGTRVQIKSIKKWTAYQRVHNFTVRDTHTYYVLAGKTPVLVHNATPCDEELARVWTSPNKTLSDSFNEHYKKRGSPLGKTEAEYQDDAKAWLDSNPARARMNSKRVD